LAAGTGCGNGTGLGISGVFLAGSGAVTGFLVSAGGIGNDGGSTVGKMGFGNSGACFGISGERTGFFSRAKGVGTGAGVGTAGIVSFGGVKGVFFGVGCQAFFRSSRRLFKKDSFRAGGVGTPGPTVFGPAAGTGAGSGEIGLGNSGPFSAGSGLGIGTLGKAGGTRGTYGISGFGLTGMIGSGFGGRDAGCTGSSGLGSGGLGSGSLGFSGLVISGIEGEVGAVFNRF